MFLSYICFQFVDVSGQDIKVILTIKDCIGGENEMIKLLSPSG